MRTFLLMLTGLVSSAFVCGPLPADERVVISDPNVSGRITAKIYAQTDAALSQKVSYEARLTSVEQVVSDLCEKTGVTLVAGARESDWHVRSRKMNIFVRDVPLCELMDSIARAMKFRWSRSDSQPWVYRLKVNGRAAAEADAMMKRADRMQEEMWRKRRQEWVDAIEKYGGTPLSQLTSLRETDPQIYEQAMLGSLQALHALFSEVPEAKERFLAGKNLRVATDDLTPETKLLAFSAGNEFWKHLQRIGFLGKKTTDPPGYGDELKADEHFDIVYKRLDVGTFTPNLRWGSASVSDTGYWHLERDGRDFEINGFRYMGTPWNRHISVGNIRINENIDVDEVRASEANEKMTVYTARYEDSLKLEESLYPSEALVEHAKSPEFERKIKLEIEKPKPDANPMMFLGESVAAMQKALFEASGMGVVSDAWMNLQLNTKLSLPDTEMKLDELLEAFCSMLNYNWDKPGPILEFRSRKWAKMRLNQIPDAWVSAWSKSTKDNGYLSLDDLAQISNISYYQAEETLRQDPVMGVTGVYGRMLEILDDNLAWLRLYSSLKPQQRDLLASERGLFGQMLTSEQWKLAQPMFERIGATRGDALMRSSTAVGKDPKQISVSFKEFDADSGAGDRIWKAELPRYTPRPLPQKAASEPVKGVGSTGARK